MTRRLTPHAQLEIRRRGLSLAEVEDALRTGQAVAGLNGRTVFQKTFAAEGKTYLLRVIAEKHAPGWRVITVYRTSKIDKYRSKL